MNPRILFLLSLLTLVGCFPYVTVSHAPPINLAGLSELFPHEDENIVVIPVWEKHPAILTDESVSETSALWLGAPVFTKAGSLRHVHDQIPDETSVILIIGPGGGVGSAFNFYGFIIASETGRYLLLGRSQDNRSTSSYGEFTYDDINELIAFMKSGNSSALDDSELWESFFDFNKIRIRFGDADRDRTISLLEPKELNFYQESIAETEHTILTGRATTQAANSNLGSASTMLSMPVKEVLSMPVKEVCNRYSKEAKRRGLTLEQCRILAGRTTTQAANSNLGSASTMLSMPAKEVCNKAIVKGRDVIIWDTSSSYARYSKEAKRRGLTLEQCAVLLKRHGPR